MKPSRQFVLYAVLTVDASLPGEEPESLPAVAVRAALQAGLNLRVDDLRIHSLTPETASRAHPGREDLTTHADWSPWATELMSEGILARPSDYDQPVERYVCSGMIITVYRNAGTERDPTYFAAISNPRAKAHGGILVRGDRKSMADVKRRAEAEAPIRYERAIRRAANAAEKAKKP
jgi:hypothetical protein